MRPDNDNAELQCICNASNANTLIPACEACVRQYDTDTDDDDGINDNDVREVLTRCNFTIQSTFNSASASSVVAAASSAASAGTTPTGSVTVTRSGTGTVVPTTAVVSQVTQNAAPAMTAAAGMGIGALGFALGML